MAKPLTLNLCQALIIMAFHDVDSPLQVFEATILEDVMSIFITSAVLKLVQGLLLLYMFERASI